ncbi:porin family protein [Methylocystis sp. FS]|uniref:outer membrane protein n=1 Tax=Methylocystis silviterrae TaxID=2743612 RepID=UPI001581D1E2|nr:outer membrane beta-barrel protein [Methylocystis silviterrae]NUJ79138.1 porin family protein [Methylocystis silviterrae]
MKRIFVTLALALTASTALAADLPSYKAPPPPPPPPPPLWTGFYVGLNAGGTWANSNSVNVSSIPVFNAGVGGAQPFQATITALSTFSAGGGNNSGFIGGGQIGYNWQFYNSFVAGVEADIQGIATSNQNTTFAGALLIPGFAQSTGSISTVNRSIDYLGTVRGRLGWLFTPTLLVYGTGGLAYGGVTSNTSIFQALIPNSIQTPVWGGAGSFSDTRVGWTAGGGLEWMFWPNWSAKVEYLYYDLGNVSYATSPLVTLAGNAPFTFNVVQSQTRFNGNIVRAGVNYHFNWGAAPIVAKY